MIGGGHEALPRDSSHRFKNEFVLYTPAFYVLLYHLLAGCGLQVLCAGGGRIKKDTDDTERYSLDPVHK